MLGNNGSGKSGTSQSQPRLYRCKICTVNHFIWYACDVGLTVWKPGFIKPNIRATVLLLFILLIPVEFREENGAYVFLRYLLLLQFILRVTAEQT